MIHPKQPSHGLLANKIHGRDDARAVAESLVASARNDFFALAACSILTEAIMSLHKIRQHQWRLRDLIEAVRAPKRLRTLLLATREGRSVCQQYLMEPSPVITRTIVSTICACMCARDP
jgi:hypothetical protein